MLNRRRRPTSRRRLGHATEETLFECDIPRCLVREVTWKTCILFGSSYAICLRTTLLRTPMERRKTMKTKIVFAVATLVFCFSASANEYLGNLSRNPYDPNSISNPYGAGNPYSPNSVTNPYGRYGNPYSNESATNRYATNAPKLYDQYGNYRGRLSKNPYDPDSISNPYGRYGNPSSPDSINNLYGAGNPCNPDSPNNPYGRGWSIYGDDD